MGWQELGTDYVLNPVVEGASLLRQCQRFLKFCYELILCAYSHFKLDDIMTPRKFNHHVLDEFTVLLKTTNEFNIIPRTQINSLLGFQLSQS